MSETVLTSETSSTPTEFNSKTRIICRVCEKQFSQYTCPRCNTRYCSLPCYKSHSLRCTESFMRENVMEELQQTQPNEESKSKMMDILKRFHEEEETDNFDEEESDSSFSEETIQKILSGAQISFNDLSLEERKHFQRAIASGDLSKLIEPWDPWWLKPSAKHISLGSDGNQLLQPIDSENDSCHHDIPAGPETPLPPLSQLTAAEPSPLLAMHLIDIIYTYCFTLRLYNGDWRADPLESATVAVNVSSVLGQAGQLPETVVEALSNCLEKTCSSDYKHMGGLKFGLGVMDDVSRILYLGGDALVCLLCDLMKMIGSGEKMVKLEKMTKMERDELRRKFKFGERKVYFVMCWVHEQLSEVWCTLAGAVLETAKNLAVECGDGKRSANRTGEKVGRVGKTLIEEV